MLYTPGFDTNARVYLQEKETNSFKYMIYKRLIIITKEKVENIETWTMYRRSCSRILSREKKRSNKLIFKPTYANRAHISKTANKKIYPKTPNESIIYFKKQEKQKLHC